MGHILHNDRIDRRIEHELQQCSIAIADLTYARPSVYYEAGFVERVSPVIYTCRRDHFQSRADDTFGNFRVHFDLQTKNIIRWTTPTDRRFQHDLRARLQHVSRPLLTEHRQREREAREEATFASLSIQTRRARIGVIAMNMARRAGFAARRIGVEPHDATLDRAWFSLASSAVHIERRGGRARGTAEIFVVDRTSTGLLRRLQRWLLFDLDAGDHSVLVTLQRTTSPAIASAFTAFTPVPSATGRAWVHDNLRGGRSTLHVIDHIRSEEMARSAIRSKFDEIGRR